MKPCNYRKLIGPYLDGELSARRRAWLEAHLEECPHCRRELDGVREILQQLRDLPTPEVPVELPRRLHVALIEETGRAHSRRGMSLMLPLAAAVCVCVIGGIVFAGGILRLNHRDVAENQPLLMVQQAEGSTAQDAAGTQPTPAAGAEQPTGGEGKLFAAMLPAPSGTEDAGADSDSTALDASAASAAASMKQTPEATGTDVAAESAPELRMRANPGAETLTTPGMVEPATDGSHPGFAEVLPWLGGVLMVGGLAAAIAISLVRRARRNP